jgi:sugar lactone lactonase YvrE
VAAGVSFPTGRFHGANPDWAIDLLPTSDAFLPVDAFSVLHDHFTVDGDQVTFAGESCGGKPGTYRWSVDGSALALKRLADGCSERAQLFAIPLTRDARQLPYAVVTALSAPLVQPDYNQSTVDASGTFYETDGSGGFYRYAPDGTVTGSWPNALTYTVGIAVDAQGRIFVSNFDDATVHVFDAQGTELRHWQVAGGTVGPVGLALDAKGDLYVALHRVQDRYVEKYAPDGTLLGRFVTAGSGPGQVTGGPSSGPEEIAVDRVGDIWITDPEDNRLVEVDASGKALRTITGDGHRAFDHPDTVAVDPEGDVYTVQGREIWAFGPNGRLKGEWFSPYAGNLVIDGRGNLFSVDQHIVALRLGRP